MVIILDISRKTLDSLYSLDKNNDGVSYQEIKQIDKNNDGKIDNKEARNLNITNQKDIELINKDILKYYDCGSNNKSRHSPTEIIFPTPKKPIDPLFISSEEKKLLKGFSIQEKQSLPLDIFTKLSDSTESFVDNTLLKINSYSKDIVQASKDFKVNPILLGAILFDEINHVKPFDSILVDYGLGSTEGLAQLSVEELVKQGIFKAEDPDLNKKGIEYLRNPKNNIRVLAGQIKRNLNELGYSNDKILSFSKYFDSHAMAKISNLHNGKYDYAKKIFSYAKNPNLIKALKGEYISKFTPTAPEPAPKPILENKVNLKVIK